MRIDRPTPELPVRDVRTAQEYYRDRFGFEIAWHHQEGRIGAVAHGDCAIFLRESAEVIHPATFWVFAENVDEAYAELVGRGAEVLDPLEDKPWGMRQFTVRDLNGNRFHFHHEIDTRNG